MSDTALLNAVEKRLRNVLGDAEGRFVGQQPEGKPPPKCGLKYVGIDDDGYQNIDQNPQGLDETFGIVVVVTGKLDYAPMDRAAKVLKLKGEVRDLARRVMLALHSSYDVVNLANAELGASVNGFIEPLRFTGSTRVEPRDASWVWAEQSDSPPTVYVRELRFTGARRVQYTESAT